jgi:hypothetical protein
LLQAPQADLRGKMMFGGGGMLGLEKNLPMFEGLRPWWRKI